LLFESCYVGSLSDKCRVLGHFILKGYETFLRFWYENGLNTKGVLEKASLDIDFEISVRSLKQYNKELLL